MKILSLRIITFLVSGIFLFACSPRQTNQFDASPVLDDAAVKLGQSLDVLNDSKQNPRYLENDSIHFVPSRDWTSGFFPGMLWYMYEFTGDPEWKTAAHHYTMNVIQEQYNGRTHDMGFKMYCSFGNGYRLTGDSLYRAVLLQGARTLVTRYNPVVGCIRSWDHNSDKWDYPVIIDNMMNLELLFWASKESGDPVFYDIAVRHAETTMQNHFREDQSSYHVLSYDTLSGEVVKRNTHQGYGHETAWARGQAWGLYGFAMTYRETGDKRFLDQARSIANFILNHPRLPADKVPFWDYDAPGQPDVYRDVSAASITASALYELSAYSPDQKEDYLDAADRILMNLSEDYVLSAQAPMPFLLDHSVGNLPDNSEIDVPIIYADYYYLEALMRKHENSQEAGIKL